MAFKKSCLCSIQEIEATLSTFAGQFRRIGLVLWHWGSRGFLLLRKIGDQGLGSQDHRCNAGGILQSRARYLGRIDDSRLDHILVLIGKYIVAILITLMLFLSTSHTLNNYRTIFTTIDYKLAQWLFKGSA